MKTASNSSPGGLSQWRNHQTACTSRYSKTEKLTYVHMWSKKVVLSQSLCISGPAAPEPQSLLLMSPERMFYPHSFSLQPGHYNGQNQSWGFWLFFIFVFVLFCFLAKLKVVATVFILKYFCSFGLEK